MRAEGAEADAAAGGHFGVGWLLWVVVGCCRLL